MIHVEETTPGNSCLVCRQEENEMYKVVLNGLSFYLCAVCAEVLYRELKYSVMGWPENGVYR